MTLRSEIRIPVLVLTVGLIGAIVGAVASEASLDRTERRSLDQLAAQARIAMERRVAASTEVLYGMRAFFSGERPVTRARFDRYVDLLDLPVREGGPIALSFDRAVMDEHVAAYESAVRADLKANGYLNVPFSVHPRVPGPTHVVVEYIAPFTTENRAALGFDVASDPVRRAAIEESRDSGAPVATGPVDVVQGGRGFIIYQAVYNREMAPFTEPARRRSLDGVVVAVFRVADMLGEVLGPDSIVDLEVYDVGRTVAEQQDPLSRSGLVFDSDGNYEALQSTAGFASADLNVADRRWRIFVRPRSPLRSTTNSLVPFGVGISGALASMLLAGLLYSFARSRRVALALANDRTAHLREREQELEATNRRLEESNERFARANSELEAAAEQLRQADRERTAFLGTISHELRTPLTAIVGFSRILLDQQSGADATSADILERIARNAGALGTLIDELLDFSRLARTGAVLRSEVVDLGQLATDVVGQLATVLSTHRVVIDTPEPVSAMADPAALARVLTNLLTNAGKFSPDGSTVSVLIGRTQDRATIAVRDQGRGVAEHERDRIFEPFYRGVEADASSAPGTGIGLAVVRTLVTEMGGEITVGNATGGGAEFSISLPVP